MGATNLAHLNRFPGIDAQTWDQIRQASSAASETKPAAGPKTSDTAEFYKSGSTAVCGVPGSPVVHIGVTADRERLSGNRRYSASSSPEGNRSPCGSRQLDCDQVIARHE